MARDRLSRFLARTLVLVAIVCFTATSSDAAGAPVEIPVVLSMTGPTAFIGQSTAGVLDIVAASVNRSGGIQGRDVKFVLMDEQGQPSTAVQLVNKIIESKAPVMLGTSLNATCSAMAPLLVNGPVDFCFTPGVHPEPGSYTFSPAPSTADLALRAAAYVKKRGWHKVAFLFSTDASGVDGEKVVTAAFDAPDMKNVTMTVEHFAIGDLSVAAQAARMKAERPDAVYVWASGTASQTALRGLQDAGIDLPTMMSYSNATAKQMAALKPYIPKELLSPGPPSMVPPDQLPPGRLRDAITRYYDAFKAVGKRPDATNATPWDAAGIAVEALRKLGPSTTAAKVRAYVENLTAWPGVTGVYNFKAIPQRGVNWNAVVMARWDPARQIWTNADLHG